jgi:hypothetical protein
MEDHLHLFSFFNPVILSYSIRILTPSAVLEGPSVSKTQPIVAIEILDAAKKFPIRNLYKIKLTPGRV